jgi:hypothetical protein
VGSTQTRCVTPRFNVIDVTRNDTEARAPEKIAPHVTQQQDKLRLLKDQFAVPCRSPCLCVIVTFDFYVFASVVRNTWEATREPTSHWSARRKDGRIEANPGNRRLESPPPGARKYNTHACTIDHWAYIYSHGSTAMTQTVFALEDQQLQTRKRNEQLTSEHSLVLQQISYVWQIHSPHSQLTQHMSSYPQILLRQTRKHGLRARGDLLARVERRLFSEFRMS